MSDSTAMDSKTRRSKPSPSDETIVELKPPPDFGFSGTAKFDAVAQAPLIAELLKRGYTKVER
jgi:hypothetical protein